jgi:hypothetical protein
MTSQIKIVFMRERCPREINNPAPEVDPAVVGRHVKIAPYSIPQRNEFPKPSRPLVILKHHRGCRKEEITPPSAVMFSTRRAIPDLPDVVVGLTPDMFRLITNVFDLIEEDNHTTTTERL